MPFMRGVPKDDIHGRRCFLRIIEPTNRTPACNNTTHWTDHHHHGHWRHARARARARLQWGAAVQSHWYTRSLTVSPIGSAAPARARAHRRPARLAGSFFTVAARRLN